MREIKKSNVKMNKGVFLRKNFWLYHGVIRSVYSFLTNFVEFDRLFPLHTDYCCSSLWYILRKLKAGGEKKNPKTLHWHNGQLFHLLLKINK